MILIYLYQDYLDNSVYFYYWGILSCIKIRYNNNNTSKAGSLSDAEARQAQ